MTWKCLLTVALASAVGAATAIAGATVEGQVLLPDGKSAAGARVVLSWYLNPGWMGAATTTDAAGQFSVPVDPVPPKGFVEVLALKAGFASDWIDAKLGAPLTLRLGAQSTTFSGVVLGPDEQPLAGAEVRLVSLGFSHSTAPRSFYFANQPPDAASPVVTTRPDGSFSFHDLPADAGVRYAAQAPGCARLDGSAAVGQGEVTILLGREATLSGRVTAGGRPLAGVTVYAFPPPGGGGKAVTAADGTYSIAHLPPGPLTVSVSAPTGFASAHRSGLVAKSGAHLTGIDFTVTPGALLSGTITQAGTGAPLAEAWVECMGNGRPMEGGASAQTAADGTWQARVPAGRYWVSSSKMTPDGKTNMSFEPAERVVQVEEGATYPALDFVASPPPTLKGRVLRPDGTPAAGVEVASAMGGALFRNPDEGVLFEPGVPVAAVTDADGRFSMTLLPWLHTPLGLPVVARDVEAGLIGQTLSTGREQQIEIHLSLGGFVQIDARDAQDRPAPDVRVTVEVAMPSGRPGVVRMGLGGNLTAGVTDPEGKLLLGPLPAGVLLYLGLDQHQRAYLLDWKWESQGKITLAEGEVRRLPKLPIDLQGWQATGTVTDAEARVVPRALVVGGPYSVTTADAQGNFTLSRLPLKARTCLLAADPLKPWFGMAAVSPDHPQGIVLQLQPLGTLSGMVVDAQGRPVAGELVAVHTTYENTVNGLRAYSPMWARLQAAGYRMGEPTSTDAQGRWRTPGLLAGGPYRVEASKRPTDIEEPLVGKLPAVVQPGTVTDLGAMTVKPRAPGVAQPILPAPPGPGAGGPAPRD